MFPMKENISDVSVYLALAGCGVLTMAVLRVRKNIIKLSPQWRSRFSSVIGRLIRKTAASADCISVGVFA